MYRLGGTPMYSAIFKTARVAKNSWRIINTIVSIWRGNMFRYFSLDIVCSSKLTVFLELRSRKTVRFLERIMSADNYPSIFSRQMETCFHMGVWGPKGYGFWSKKKVWILTILAWNKVSFSLLLDIETLFSASTLKNLKPFRMLIIIGRGNYAEMEAISG